MSSYRYVTKKERYKILRKLFPRMEYTDMKHRPERFAFNAAMSGLPGNYQDQWDEILFSDDDSVKPRQIKELFQRYQDEELGGDRNKMTFWGSNTVPITLTRDERKFIMASIIRYSLKNK